MALSYGCTSSSNSKKSKQKNPITHQNFPLLSNFIYGILTIWILYQTLCIQSLLAFQIPLWPIASSNSKSNVDYYSNSLLLSATGAPLSWVVQVTSHENHLPICYLLQWVTLPHNWHSHHNGCGLQLFMKQPSNQWL